MSICHFPARDVSGKTLPGPFSLGVVWQNGTDCVGFFVEVEEEKRRGWGASVNFPEEEIGEKDKQYGMFC